MIDTNTVIILYILPKYVVADCLYFITCTLDGDSVEPRPWLNVLRLFNFIIFHQKDALKSPTYLQKYFNFVLKFLMNLLEHLCRLS